MKRRAFFRLKSHSEIKKPLLVYLRRAKFTYNEQKNENREEKHLAVLNYCVEMKSKIYGKDENLE